MTSSPRQWGLVLLFAAVIGSSAFLGSCAGRGSGASSAEVAVARAAERLKGRWTLVEFRPEQPLEPFLGALLAAQMGNLVLTLDGQNLDAQGVGIGARRTYVVQEAEDEGFAAAILESGSLEYRIVGHFQGRDLYFTAQTPPWRGTGRLVRAD